MPLCFPQQYTENEFRWPLSSPDALLPFSHTDTNNLKVSQTIVIESCHSGLWVHNGFPIQHCRAGCSSDYTSALEAELHYEGDESIQIQWHVADFNCCLYTIAVYHFSSQEYVIYLQLLSQETKHQVSKGLYLFLKVILLFFKSSLTAV